MPKKNNDNHKIVGYIISYLVHSLQKFSFLLLFSTSILILISFPLYIEYFYQNHCHYFFNSHLHLNHYLCNYCHEFHKNEFITICYFYDKISQNAKIYLAKGFEISFIICKLNKFQHKL